MLTVEAIKMYFLNCHPYTLRYLIIKRPANNEPSYLNIYLWPWWYFRYFSELCDGEQRNVDTHIQLSRGLVEWLHTASETRQPWALARALVLHQADLGFTSGWPLSLGHLPTQSFFILKMVMILLNLAGFEASVSKWM